jgi:translation initiation factor IF-3
LIKGKYNFRLNNQINSPEVRVIGSDGKQLGVLKTGDALKKAQELELDLVEIAPLAKPPVAKIVDIGKFTYELEKKEKKERKKTKASELKEIRFSPFIGEHDYNVRITRIKEFFGNSNKVKVVVVFLGRQMSSKEFGYNLLERIQKEFEGMIAIDMKPKFLGRHLVMVISPIKKAILRTNKPISTNEHQLPVSTNSK